MVPSGLGSVSFQKYWALYSMNSHQAFDTFDPSGMRDACHMILKLWIVTSWFP